MKKVFVTIMAVCTLVTCLLFPASAAEPEIIHVNDGIEWVDVELTDEEINDILAENPNNAIMPVANDLINFYNIAIKKNGTNLSIAGKTVGTNEVTFSGFTEVVIKRRPKGGSWSTYKTYENLYTNLSTYVLTKSITGTSGYEYKVECVHYARKNLLVYEKLPNTSNTVAF